MWGVGGEVEDGGGGVWVGCIDEVGGMGRMNMTERYLGAFA